MIKILFICHGNICRSPMCEFVFKNMVKQEGLAQYFEIESAATSTEEIGNPVYPPAKRELAAHGLSCEGKRARQMSKRDYEYFDYILVAENYNIRNLKWIIGEDKERKVRRLLDFTENPRDISDPWYHGDFQKTYGEIMEGCEAFLNYCKENDLK